MKKFILPTIALICFVIAFFYFLYRGPIIGAYNRAFNMPSIVKENNFALWNEADSRDDLIKAFYRSYKNGDAFAGFKQERRSIEATPIILYLITQAGKITLILDYTYDKFGGRGIVVENPTSLSIGTIDPNWNFTEIKINDINDVQITGLRLKIIHSKGEEIII